MKSLFIFSILALVAAFALTGCNPLPPGTPLSETIEKVYDNGTVDLPGTPFKVHGYRITRPQSHSHYLYFLQNADGALVSGVQANQPFNAGRQQRNEVVSTDISQVAVSKPAQQAVELTVRLSCASVEECQKKLALLNQKN